MRRQNIPVRYDKLDVSKVVIEKPQKNAIVDSQLMSYPRYEDNQLLIQTPMMKLVSGGIPSADSKYHLDAKSRANNIKIPFDTENLEAMKLYDVLIKLDNYLDSDEFRKTIFDKPDQYSYQPIVREPVDMGDDDDDKKKSKPKYNYMKVRLALDIDGDDIKVKTSVFQKNENGVREKLITNTVDEIAKYVRYLSNVRFVIMANKFYATKNKDPKTKKYTYGLTFKVQQVEVEPTKSNAKFDFDTPQFDDNDEDNEINNAQENIAKISFTTKDSDLDLDLDDGLDKIDDEAENTVEDATDEPVVATSSKKGKKKTANA